MTFAQLTYRESLCDIEACLRAQKHKHYHMGIRGGTVKMIACIEDPVVIEKIFTHLNKKAASAGTGPLLASRASP